MRRNETLAMAMLALARATHAQVTGQLNQAVLPSTVNAAALERPSRVSLAYGSYGRSTWWLAGVGVGIGRASLHFLANNQYRDRGINIGYAQVLSANPLRPSLGASVGVDMTGGFLRRSWDSKTSYVARLSVPLAMRWGDSSRVSLTGYLAPYGELGRAPRYGKNLTCNTPSDCVWDYAGLETTSALGVGAGFRMAAWRFGLDGGLREPLDFLQPRDSNPFIVLLTFRF